MLCTFAYLHERRTYPLVWARAMPYYPEIQMRGRQQLRLGLNANGCGRIPLNRSPYEDPRNPHKLKAGQTLITANMSIPVKLGVEGNSLVAFPAGQQFFGSVTAMVMPAANCDLLPILPPVDFSLPEGVTNPFPLQAGQELWIELSVPRTALPDRCNWR